VPTENRNLRESSADTPPPARPGAATEGRIPLSHPAAPRPGGGQPAGTAAPGPNGSPSGPRTPVAQELFARLPAFLRDTTMSTTLPSRLLSARVYLLPVIHLTVFAVSYLLAWVFRFDFAIQPTMWDHFWRTLPGVVALKLTVFYLAGNYHGWWRHVTFSDLVALLRAATLSNAAIGFLDLFLNVSYQIPRSILILDWAMCILMVGGLRSVWRFAREQFKPLLQRNGYRRAFIVGANEVGVTLAGQIHSDPHLGYRVVGFLDPDPGTRGTRLGGIPVLGGLDVVARIPDTAAGVKTIFVIAGSLPGKVLRGLMEDADLAGVTVKVVPAVSDLLAGRHRLEPRDVDINDLLRREPIELDCGAIDALLAGQVVLVTGAGGSIGCEICRQVLRFRPRTLVLVERAENNLFVIERELQAQRTPVQIQACVADVLDLRRMRQIFQRYRPDVVFHAAAHKHVPLMESHPREAIRNNVVGTKRLADLAHAHRVQSFVLISTDKAVNPTSVMGVTKQLAERYVHAISQASQTRFVVVRFGNVLGSVGSVVPIFQEQIRRGGPITITHPEMRRFFMTIPEASQLVLQAAAMGRGGEIFVLDMGEPVKIVDLARDLIRLSGLSADDIEISIIGPRPGEKMYEEIYLEDEQTLPTPHPKVRVAYHRPFSLQKVRQQIFQLRRRLEEPDEVIRKTLMELVPEYTPSTLVKMAGVSNGNVVSVSQ
jgi:FlaA1/EpsC-like NDP-sugar epimerase